MEPTIKTLLILLSMIILFLAGCSGNNGNNGATGATGFQRYPGNPVYTSSHSTWNFAAIGDPCVIYDSDEGIYKMWTSSGGTIPANTSTVIVRI